MNEQIFDHGIPRTVPPGYMILSTDVRSYGRAPPTRTLWFAQMTDEGLRRFAEGTGPGNYQEYSRAMLLALLTNRYPCGYVIEIADEGDE